jgi:hypothetical protein
VTPAIPAEVIKWIAENFVANEVGFCAPVPRVLREPLAEEMVSNGFMGWPDKETALAHLDELWDFA